jgi:hypothetical protein
MGWISKSGSLTQTEMENNALLFISKCRALGVNDTTIAALLGNSQAESTVNPERVESGGGGGYGLFQWTPKTSLTEHCATLGISPYTDGEVQLECLYYEILGQPSSVKEWYSTQAFLSQGNWFDGAGDSSMVGITGEQFLTNSSNWAADYLARLFMCAYERPAHSESTNHWKTRVSYANTWYEFITGVAPAPTPTPTKRRKMPLWMMLRY